MLSRPVLTRSSGARGWAWVGTHVTAAGRAGGESRGPVTGLRAFGVALSPGIIPYGIGQDGSERVMPEHHHEPALIREKRDFDAALLELRALCDLHDWTPQQRTRARELERATDLFLKYCPGNSTRPRPDRFVCYLLDHVKPALTADVARETGIADLADVLLGKREFAAEEAAVLGDYFGVPPDSFQLTAEERERDQEERQRGW